MVLQPELLQAVAVLGVLGRGGDYQTGGGRMNTKCYGCGHQSGWRRNIVKLSEWPCGCECHIYEDKTAKRKQTKATKQEAR